MEDDKRLRRPKIKTNKFFFSKTSKYIWAEFTSPSLGPTNVIFTWCLHLTVSCLHMFTTCISCLHHIYQILKTSYCWAGPLFGLDSKIVWASLVLVQILAWRLDGFDYRIVLSQVFCKKAVVGGWSYSENNALWLKIGWVLTSCQRVAIISP